MVPRIRRQLPILAQRDALYQFNEHASIQVSKRRLTWIGDLTPSPISLTYTVKIVYEIGEYPKIYVLSPELIIAHGSKLPHVYSTSEQNLCLFYPDQKGWLPSKLIASTILLWASEWLFHYEIWVATGNWNGGGTNH